MQACSLKVPHASFKHQILNLNWDRILLSFIMKSYINNTYPYCLCINILSIYYPNTLPSTNPEIKSMSSSLSHPSFQVLSLFRYWIPYTINILILYREKLSTYCIHSNTRHFQMCRKYPHYTSWPILNLNIAHFQIFQSCWICEYSYSYRLFILRNKIWKLTVWNSNFCLIPINR